MVDFSPDSEPAKLYEDSLKFWAKLGKRFWRKLKKSVSCLFTKIVIVIKFFCFFVFDPILTKFCEIVALIFIIRKRILLHAELEPLTLKVRTNYSINWAIQAIDIILHFIVKFIYDIEMKMCSNKFVSRINEDFLQWESSRHHLWLI